jgi:hypothetical protein
MKYPFTSITTLVGSDGRIEIDPFDPLVTSALFANTAPKSELSVEVAGIGSPVGQAVMYQRAAAEGITVKLSEYAFAVEGIPCAEQFGLAQSRKLRVSPDSTLGDPNSPGASLVSTARQGGIAT